MEKLMNSARAGRVSCARAAPPATLRRITPSTPILSSTLQVFTFYEYSSNRHVRDSWT